MVNRILVIRILVSVEYHQKVIVNIQEQLKPQKIRVNFVLNSQDLAKDSVVWMDTVNLMFVIAKLITEEKIVQSIVQIMDMYIMVNVLKDNHVLMV